MGLRNRILKYGALVLVSAAMGAGITKHLEEPYFVCGSGDTKYGINFSGNPSLKISNINQFSESAQKSDFREDFARVFKEQRDKDWKNFNLNLDAKAAAYAQDVEAIRKENPDFPIGYARSASDYWIGSKALENQ